jgi:hypothetical protein
MSSSSKSRRFKSFKAAQAAKGKNEKVVRTNKGTYLLKPNVNLDRFNILKESGLFKFPFNARDDLSKHRQMLKDLEEQTRSVRVSNQGFKPQKLPKDPKERRAFLEAAGVDPELARRRDITHAPVPKYQASKPARVRKRRNGEFELRIGDFAVKEIDFPEDASEEEQDEIISRVLATEKRPFYVTIKCGAHETKTVYSSEELFDTIDRLRFVYSNKDANNYWKNWLFGFRIVAAERDGANAIQALKRANAEQAFKKFQAKKKRRQRGSR